MACAAQWWGKKVRGALLPQATASPHQLVCRLVQLLGEVHRREHVLAREKAHRHAQVVLPEEEDVDPWERSDLLHVGDAVCRLHLLRRGGGGYQVPVDARAGMPGQEDPRGWAQGSGRPLGRLPQASTGGRRGGGMGA